MQDGEALASWPDDGGARCAAGDRLRGAAVVDRAVGDPSALCRVRRTTVIEDVTARLTLAEEAPDHLKGESEVLELSLPGRRPTEAEAGGYFDRDAGTRGPLPVT